jgi:stage II sporulation protein D
MIKKLIFIFLFIIGIQLFSNEISNGIKNKTVIRVGVKTLAKPSLYLKAIGGSIFFKYGENVEEIKEREFIKIECKNNRIFYLGKIVEEILTARGKAESITAISGDGKNYRKYRGDFKFIAKDGLVFPINNIYIEDYICGVIPGEIGINFPDEAIKAQILAARTYAFTAVKNKGRDIYDVVDTTDSQVYLGYEVENKKINEFIYETEGEVITYRGNTINAYYHSTSGGETANIEDVWKSNPVPYLKSVDDSKYEISSPRAEWTYRVSAETLSKIVGINVEEITVVEKKNARVSKLSFIGEKDEIVFLEGNDIRKRIGYNKVFSTIFEVRKDGKEFLFKGKGSGHGVGMSQWGAAGFAKKGKKYIDILKFYYTDVEIINLEKM